MRRAARALTLWSADVSSAVAARLARRLYARAPQDTTRSLFGDLPACQARRLTRAGKMPALRGTPRRRDAARGPFRKRAGQPDVAEHQHIHRDDERDRVEA